MNTSTSMTSFLLRVALLAVLATAGLHFGAVTHVAAADGEQTKPTLRVAVVNTAGGEGERVAETVERLLHEASRIEVADAQRFLTAGDQFGVTTETLRKRSQRERHVADFEVMLRESDIDALLVLDVFAGKAQVVLIGPGGRQLHDARRQLDDGRLAPEQGKAMLRASFKKLLPVWRQHAEKHTAEVAEPASEPVADTQTTRAALLDDTTDDATPSAPVLRPGVDLWLGGMAGRHSLTAGSDAGYDLGQMVPLVGMSLRLEAVLGRFDNRRSGFGIDVFGAYAPFEVGLTGRGANQETSRMVQGQFTHVGGDLNYLNQLGESLRLKLGAGFEVLSLMVASNPLYTGNRYAQARLSAGLAYQPFRRLTLGVDAGAAPILSSDMSGGAFAQQAFTAAWLAGARARLTMWNGINAQLGYRLYAYDVVYRQSELTVGETRVQERYQMLELQVSYGF